MYLQYSLFPESEQMCEVERVFLENSSVSSSTISQDIIDIFLKIGSNSDNVRMVIASEFSKEKSNNENAVFLQTVFHGGNGITVNDSNYAAWYAEDGIHIAVGNNAQHVENAKIISWTDTAERIAQLLNEGNFATKTELTEADNYEKTQIASKLWYIYHDLTVEAFENDYLKYTGGYFTNGFSADIPTLVSALSAEASRGIIIKECCDFLTTLNGNRKLLRYYYPYLDEIGRCLNELNMPRKAYSSEIIDNPNIEQFITEDEISETLSTGSGFAKGKKRIYQFFTDAAHDVKEKAEFLKKEYGTGSKSHAVSGASHSYFESNGSGVHPTKEGCPKIHLPWNKAANRITELIEAKRYLTAKEIAEIEKEHVA